MRLPKPRPLPPTVPVAALATVTLLLVFFFLLSTSYAPDLSDVVLPRGPALHEAAAGSACLIIVRRVSATTGEELEFRFSERSGESRTLSGPTSLFFEASRIVEADPERTFLLRIDAGVRYAVVDDVLERLRNAGVRNVVLGARSDEPGGA